MLTFPLQRVDPLYYDGTQPDMVAYDNDNILYTGDCLVETSGYIPKEAQLQNMYEAGVNLDAYRRGQYPGMLPPDNDPDFDPTAQIGFDFFDAHELAQIVSDNLTAAQRQAHTDLPISDVGTAPQYNANNPPAYYQPPATTPTPPPASTSTTPTVTT